MVGDDGVWGCTSHHSSLRDALSFQMISILLLYIEPYMPHDRTWGPSSTVKHRMLGLSLCRIFPSR